MKINLKQLKKKFNNDGYVVLKKLITKNDAKIAKEDLINFLEEMKKDVSLKKINFTNKNEINSVHGINEWKWIKKFKKNKVILDTVKELLESRSNDFGSELFDKTTKIGLAAPVHQDNYYWCIDDANALTVWIALNDSSKKNGGVYYYKKSHKIGILEHKPSYAPGSSQTIKYPEGMKVFDLDFPNLKAGDCLIHHCLVVHGSNPNKSNHPRTGCTLRYISKKSKIDKFMQDKYNKSLEKHFKKLKS